MTYLHIERRNCSAFWSVVENNRKSLFIQTLSFPDFISTWLDLFLHGHYCLLSITSEFHIRVHRIWIESSDPVVQWNLPSIFLTQTSSLTFLWSIFWTLSTSIDSLLVFPLKSSIKLRHLNLILTWHPPRMISELLPSSSHFYDLKVLPLHAQNWPLGFTGQKEVL